MIKLAGRGGAFDLETEFGIPADRVVAWIALPAWPSLSDSKRCATPASRW